MVKIGKYPECKYDFANNLGHGCLLCLPAGSLDRIMVSRELGKDGHRRTSLGIGRIDSTHYLDLRGTQKL